MHHTCTVVPLLLFLLTFWTTQAQVEWIVENGGVTDYGQNLTLFCKVDNCCIKDSGWVQWNYDSIDFRTLIIDVTGFRNEKYSGKKRQDGFTLVISRLNETDLNRNYSCTYGGKTGAKKLLLKEEAFNRSKYAEANNSAVAKAGLSTGGIVVIIAVIIVAVIIVAGITIIAVIVIKRYKNGYKQASTNEVTLEGNPKKDEKIDWATASDMAALVVKEIVPGVSVTKWEKMAAGYSVMCTIVIENWTKYILIDAVAYIKDGQISSPPIVVGPGKKEILHTTRNGLQREHMELLHG
ncbi:uncharacterized protein LOC143079785 isoform X2 [Mytilus galloprovincialis]|uniref:uncharacterized protein LOC143079785 isoform X2 n=1 Tax=Mytilus galloprovincialis TaxID=29158 RepID=UPI003F7BB0CE